MTSPVANTDSPRARLLGLFGSKRGDLAVGGVPAADLAQQFGTPLFAYDAEIARRQLAAVRAAFGTRVEVLYALKANPCVRLARALRLAGAGAELASGGEVLLARAAGFDGAAMQFAGPGKSAADLAVALEAGVGTLNVESAAEYAAVRALAQEQRVRPGVALRVNLSQQATGARVRMSGGSKKFGIDESAVLPLAQAIVRDDVCELRGLHVYGGSQNFDAASWVASARGLTAVAQRVEQGIARPLAQLNFGGGFGIPTVDGDPSFDLVAAGRGAGDLVRGAREDQRFSIELGRYLVAECGVYLTRVLDVKESGGKRFAIVDGGMHHFGAAAGLGAVIKRAYPVVACAQPDARTTAPWSLGGPLCTPADELGADVALPQLHAGDLIAVLLAGAYGFTFSPTLFLSHPTPAEVVVENGVAQLARARGSMADVLAAQQY
jgi:diaminopimelate decarboxylase